MKKLIMAFTLALGMIVAGCKTVPSSGTVYTLSEAVGVAAGEACILAMEQGKFDDKTRTVTLEVLDIVARVTPDTNTTFTAAWTPVVTEVVDKYIAEGKIDAFQGMMIKTAMSLVTQALDYEFDVRHPTWKQYQDVVSAAVHGVVDGFTMVIKPVNPAMCCAYDKPEADAEVLEVLKAGLKR